MNNPVKEKLKNKEVTLGSWIMIGHPEVAEIMAQAGFDWIAVDIEHSPINFETVQALFQAMKGTNCQPFVRLSDNDPVVIKRVMDCGATGIIVPMVNSMEDAEKAIKAVKYPPEGNRGVGLGRASGYGAHFEDYFKTINDQVVVIVMIEHIDAVNNIDSILSVPGIDGIFIGPYDLSGSMGIAGQLEHPDVIDAREKVIKSAHKHNIALGIYVVYPNSKEVKNRIEEGYTFIAYSTDTIMLGEECRKFMLFNTDTDRKE